MSEYRIKLGAALPKGDPNGWDDTVLAKALADVVTDGHELPPRTAVIIYDAKDVKIGTDGTITVTARVRLVQPVSTLGGRRALKEVLTNERRVQTGAAVAPFDVDSVVKAAFVDLPRTDEEIDVEEAEEQDRMSPIDDLRRHLERVHGVAGVAGLTATELAAKHNANHDGGLPDALAHEPTWIGWTRADLEAAEVEYTPAESEPTTADGPNEHDGGEQGHDPDLGRDLDDEREGIHGALFSSLEDEADDKEIHGS
jgi:hypothetical protein